tara:strand:- start:2958 stop:3668 length:711 start_codon:yes stop_codon:yes gene_type:complete
MLNNLKVKIYADGANYKEIKNLDNNRLVSGFTTNPTLLKNNGINNYKNFAKKVLKKIRTKPISFEVIADKLSIMEEQAFEINSWGKNVYVKIPVTNTKGEFCGPILRNLSKEKVKLNVTAIFTDKQVNNVLNALDPKVHSCISVFAGRIADTGTNPINIMKRTLKKIKKNNCDLIWASPREVLNIVEANKIGCDIITVTPDLLSKFIKNYKKDLNKFSIETVKMFYNDAKKSKLQI